MQTEQEYKTFFEALATSHADIDSFVFGDDTTFTSVQRSTAASGIVLWLDYYNPIQGTGGNDSFKGRLTAEFNIMQPAGGRQQTDAQLQTILNTCQQVAQQVVAKIMYDYNQATGPVTATPDYNTFKHGRSIPKTWGATSYEGIAAQLDFIVPLDMNYNPAKWL